MLNKTTETLELLDYLKKTTRILHAALISSTFFGVTVSHAVNSLVICAALLRK